MPVGPRATRHVRGLENKKERLFWGCAHNHPAILRHTRSLFPANLGLDGSSALTQRNGSEWTEMTRDHDLVQCRRDSVVVPPAGSSPFRRAEVLSEKVVPMDDAGKQRLVRIFCLLLDEHRKGYQG
jgi:hypothetical protein